MESEMQGVDIALAALMSAQSTLLNEAVQDIVSLATGQTTSDTHGRLYCEICFDDIEIFLNWHHPISCGANRHPRAAADTDSRRLLAFWKGVTGFG